MKFFSRQFGRSHDATINWEYDKLPTPDVAAGKYAELLVSWEYHFAHCTFMWKKIHRAILKEGPLDSYVGNLNHTLHCQKMLLDREAALADINTAIRMKFPDCPI